MVETDALPHRHLMTVALNVDFQNMVAIGRTPTGHRTIAPVTGGTFEGERLSGTVLGGEDWAITRATGNVAIDVRVTLQTEDAINIYLTYQGAFRAVPEVMQRFAAGEVLDPSDYVLAITARFECGARQLSWLNEIVAAGTGRQTPAGPVYSIYEIG
ncbi:MAG: DUF3237 domain-containing protein [Pseudomonadota bacterium]